MSIEHSWKFFVHRAQERVDFSHSRGMKGFIVKPCRGFIMKNLQIITASMYTKFLLNVFHINKSLVHALFVQISLMEILISWGLNAHCCAAALSFTGKSNGTQTSTSYLKTKLRQQTEEPLHCRQTSSSYVTYREMCVSLI